MFTKPLSTIIEMLSGDTYDTPEDTHRFIGDRIFLNSRWWFYIRFLRVLFKSSWSARRGTFDTLRWIQTSHAIFKDIEGCGGRFHIKGLDNLKKSDEPLVIVSNHMSTLETMVFPGIIAPFRNVNFVVKDVLVKGLVFGPIISSRNPIVVSRKNAFDDFRIVLAKGEEILNNRFSLIIFPQSTRSLDFVPKKFNTLGIKLAKKVGVKVLPTAIKTDYWGSGKILKGFGVINRNKPIHIEFGEPIEIKGNGKEEHERIIEFITSRLEQWGGAVSLDN